MSKLRENAKLVIGVGVKKSTSDLLIACCDEFIYYDDLVREQKRQKPATPREKKAPAATKAPAEARGKEAPKEAVKDAAKEAAPAAEPRGEGRRAPAAKDRDEAKVQEALDLIYETVVALGDERSEDDTIWGSMVKQALKRRKPGFNEGYYGFRSFNQLLEEARDRGLLDLERDAKSGGYAVWALE